MKKFLFFAAACVALVACNNKDNALNGDLPIQPGQQITLTANVDFSQGSNSPIRTMAPNTPVPTTADQTVNFHWEKGDKVMITDGDTKYSLFTIDDNSIQGTTANFTGTALDDMSAYYVIYAGKDISEELAEQILSCTYELNNAANNYNIVAFSVDGNESGFTLNSFATMLRLQLTGDGVTLGSLKYYTGYGAGIELKTTINFGTDGLALSSTTQEVWVPASSVESNMTIRFYDTDGKLIMEKSAGLASVLSGDNDLVLCPALEVKKATPSPKDVFKDGSTFTVKLESKDYANIISFKYNGNTSTFACTYVYNSAYTVDLTDVFGPYCICTKGTGNTFTFDFAGEGYLDYNADVTPATAVMRAGTNPESEFMDFNLTQFKVNDVDIIDQITVSKQQ